MKPRFGILDCWRRRFGKRDSGYEERSVLQHRASSPHAVFAVTNPQSRIPNPRRATRASGFTLLEMLAVIALIGIVAVAVITKVIPSFDKGKYKTGKIQLNTLSQDVDNYMLDNGSPPHQLQDLVVKPVNAPNWQGPYAKESQLKDPYGHDFGYQYPGQHAKYDLIFYGEDGKPGGEGLNADAGNWQ